MEKNDRNLTRKLAEEKKIKRLRIRRAKKIGTNKIIKKLCLFRIEKIPDPNSLSKS